MNSTAFLSGRDALDPVSTHLALKAISAGTGDIEREALVPGARVRVLARAGQSTQAVGESDVGVGEFSNEAAGILATLGRPDLDPHGTSPRFETTPL